MKRFILACCAIAIVLPVLAGCGNPRGAQAKTEAPTEIVMYLIGSPARDYDLVLAELNKKALQDLNMTVKVNWIGWGDTGTKYPLVLASGEPIDLIYVATWLNYYQEAQKGAFMALDEIGPKYAPTSFSTEPADGLEQAKVGGKIYALPPNYTTYTTYGVIARGDLMKKYNIPEIKDMAGYAKYLDAIVTNEKTLDPTGMWSTVNPIEAPFYYQKDWYPLSGDVATNSPFWIDLHDPSGKVLNIVDASETVNILKTLKSWSEKGYWPKSVLSNKDEKMMQTGKAASRIHNLDTWISEYRNNPQNDLQYTTMLTHSYALPYMQDGMSVPSSSKHPDKALQFLDKLRNDESYYMLLTYGLAGKHYEITSDNLMKTLDMDGFTPEMYCSWGFRDSRFRRDMVGSPPNLAKVREEIKNSAIKNVYTNFSQNIEPVKNEYAAVMNVMQQYFVPLKLGYTDPVKGLAELKAQLKAAGVDKVQAEFQRQIDAYLASKK